MTKIVNLLQIAIISILVPYAIIMFAVKLTLTSQYLEIAYRLPNMPDDTLGFTFNDRLKWSKLSVTYLNGNFDKPFLRKQFLENGDRVFNSREIAHLEDVKILVQNLVEYWLINLLILFTLGIVYYSSGWFGAYKIGLLYGLWFTICAILILGVTFVLNFSGFFTNFHKVFFIGDSWLFPYEDTLIRLFPYNFWKNVSTAIGVLALIYSYLFIVILRRFPSGK